MLKKLKLLVIFLVGTGSLSFYTVWIRVRIPGSSQFFKRIRIQGNIMDSKDPNPQHCYAILISGYSSDLKSQNLSRIC